MSAIPRLFVKSNLALAGPVALDDGQAKYLVKVLRLKLSDSVHVFNGRDGEWRAEIDMIEGRAVFLKVVEQLRPQRKIAAALELIFAPLKKAPMDFLIEKSTELGVNCLRPVLTEYTQTRKIRLERMQSNVLAAAEQTGRLNLPQVEPLTSLVKVLAAHQKTDRVILFCDEASAAPNAGTTAPAETFTTCLTRLTGKPISILIGPEGGFSPAERTQLREMENVHAVSLGPRILRAETAALAALAIYQAVSGDWQSKQI